MLCCSLCITVKFSKYDLDFVFLFASRTNLILETFVCVLSTDKCVSWRVNFVCRLSVWLVCKVVDKISRCDIQTSILQVRWQTDTVKIACMFIDFERK